MLLAKHGGGVGIGINQIRPASAKIKGNGTSDGVVPFCKIYDSTILATNQGSVRRGAASVNLNIEHPDFEEWLEIREPKGDVNRQSLNLHQCAVVGDKLCEELKAEILQLENYGESYYKSVKQLENLIYYLREIQTRITQQLTKSTV